MLSYTAARAKVIEVAAARRGRAGSAPRSEKITLLDALGRVLAEQVAADRDYPPFPRATRDGFAVRAADAAAPSGGLELIGEIKAGDAFSKEIRAGQAVQIMTGAAVPAGADAVVMVEHTRRAGNRVEVERAIERGQNIVPRGSEIRGGQTVLAPGQRLGYAELALLAQVGCNRVEVFRRPRVAILSTGDEVVELDRQPGPFQIRNSNGLSLAAQTAMAGAEPVPLGNAADRPDELRAKIEAGLQEDILVLSGGVSMGKYDFVETVLGQLGAEFYFDAVAIRPGRPAVFGVCRDRLVFGLPGNPVSTMVTFELLVLPAIDLVGGTAPRPLPLFRAKLEQAVRQKAAVTHFLPAQLAWTTGEPVVRELPWQGSGDVGAVAQANCFLVVPASKLEWAEGEWIEVLPRRGML
jgi:molybdopterin molybdotransferase